MWVANDRWERQLISSAMLYFLRWKVFGHTLFYSVNFLEVWYNQFINWKSFIIPNSKFVTLKIHLYGTLFSAV